MDKGGRRRSRFRRTIVAAGFLLFSILILFLVIGRLEHGMIFFPYRPIEAEPSDIPLDFEDVRLQTEDGVEIHGWWIPSDGAEATVLMFHGNAGNISHRLQRISFFHDLGVDTLIIDYRGYGRSQGRPSEKGLYRDATAAYRHLTEVRRIDPSRIVIFGKSLGGAVATDLAVREKAGGLVLESTFTSIRDMARLLIPILPVHLLVRTRLDSLSKIPRLEVPLLVIHGDRDEIVPFEQGKRIFEAATSETEFLSIPGAGHNDVLDRGGDPYREAFRTFFDRLRR